MNVKEDHNPEMFTFFVYIMEHWIVPLHLDLIQVFAMAHIFAYVEKQNIKSNKQK